MHKVAKFEKVSFEQFEKDFNGCKRMSISASEAYANIILPVRATSGSAGYDLISPVPFRLEEGETIKITTGLRAGIDDGWVLLVLPKSGLGTKFRFTLDNTCGVIDSDYYYADNEGHIMITMTNNCLDGKAVEIPAGKAFAQAIFVPFGITYDDEADGIRTGGFGSTGA